MENLRDKISFPLHNKLKAINLQNLPPGFVPKVDEI